MVRLRTATLALVLLGGLIAPSAHASDPGYLACVHPYPCGDEWPDGLQGPFELREIVRVKIPMDDGVLMDGWIGMPAVPAGVKVPVALSSSPYLYFCSVNIFLSPLSCSGGPGDPQWWTDPPGESGLPRTSNALPRWGVPPLQLVRRGIAVAFVSVRGTGNSGGCLDIHSPRERRDQGEIVEWLSRQPWSNGRVAMGGISYPGTTPLMAAVENVSALKAIVVGGIVSDPYLFDATPQGAKTGASHSFAVGQALSLAAPPLGGGAQHGVVDHAPNIPERACPEFADLLIRDASEVATDDRGRDFYDARRLIDDFPKVTAAALVAHGLRDDTGHAFQDSELWRTMSRAPKRLIEGQWGHTFPFGSRGRLSASWTANTWDQIVLRWLDFWLWGKGPLPEGLGTVAYQDHLDVWRESSAWPPAEARNEVLYLGGHAMRTTPGGDARRYRSAPNLLNSYRAARLTGFPVTPWDALCPTPATDAAGVSGVVYMTPPLSSAVTIAGNPHAYLRLESDLPGGIVRVKLIDIAPNFACDAQGQPTNVRFLAGGGADLRFHTGTFTGRDFPTGVATNVRIDIFDLAETIRPGHRLALEVGYGESHIESVGQPYPSTITVRTDGGASASHVVLPIVQGTLGGSAPTLTYPPRPFLPETS